MDIQKEIKPWPLAGYAPGNYMNTCAYCKKQMEKVDKLCFMCLECALIETHKYISHLEKRERLLSTLVPNPESPVDRGVEKAAEELTVSIQELAEQHCRDKDYSERQFEIGEESFIAGAKWAGNDADYWKQRCEAAEAYMSLMRNNYCYEQDHARIKWQTLKEKQLNP